MIALGLLVVLAAYVGLFVLVGKFARSRSSRIGMWLLLLLPLIYKTWDMPMGYYKFKKLCEAEGGLKVYEKNLTPAKVVRMQAEYFNRATAEDILIRYSSISAVEAEDEHFSSITPRAYARYERNGYKEEIVQPYGKTVRSLVLKSSLLDKVEVRPNGRFVSQRGKSDAQYFLTKEYESLPIRLNVDRYRLRKPDGALVATYTFVHFSWTDAKRSLFGRTASEDCGNSWDGRTEIMNLIAQPMKND